MSQLKYFFNIFIDNENITPLLASKKSFSFGSSITSLYPTAHLVLYLPSTMI